MHEQPFVHAQWIMAKTDLPFIRDRYYVYRTVFTARPVARAALYVSAHSQYAVYLNGLFVDAGQMDDYESLQFYDTLEIAGFLTAEENLLEIRQYVCGTDCSTRRAAVPGVIFALWGGGEEWAVSSTSCLSGADLHYRKNEEFITWQQGYNFEYDATAPDPVLLPSVLAQKDKSLMPRPTKKLIVAAPVLGKIRAQGVFRENDAALPKARRMQTAYLSACCQGELGDSSEGAFAWRLPRDRQADGVYFVLDLGGESAGWLTLSLDVPETAEVFIGFGEHLDDLRVRSFVGGRNFCCRYTARAGHNEFFHPFQRLGLRYLQLHIYAPSGILHGAGLRPTVYPVIRKDSPVADGLHRRIWETGVKTLELCMHEHYEDCPWREQALYTMDSRIQILCGYYAFDNADFAKASLMLMLPALRPDGLIELCPPGRVPVNIPCFTAVYIREVWEYTEQTGDWSLAREALEAMKAIVDGFAARVDETGLIPLYSGKDYWNFYEWRPGLDGETPGEGTVYEAPLGAFISDAFACFSALCHTLRPEWEATFLRAHERLNSALHQAFYDEAAGGYLTRLGDAAPRHTLTQGLMLYVGAVPLSQVHRVEQAVIHGKLIPASLSMCIYVYEALLKNRDRHLNFVRSEVERIWGGMLDAGADTFWETEKGTDDFDGAGSLCHGWSSVPVYLFGKYNLISERGK